MNSECMSRKTASGTRYWENPAAVLKTSAVGSRREGSMPLLECGTSRGGTELDGVRLIPRRP